MYTIILKGKARKDYKKLQASVFAKKGNQLIHQIQLEPHDIVGLEKLHFAADTYAARINGQHRLVFTLDREHDSAAIISAWSHYQAIETK